MYNDLSFSDLEIDVSRDGDLFTMDDFRIGQPCHYSGESGTLDLYLRVTGHRAKIAMVFLSDEAQEMLFCHYPDAKGLVPITEEQYKNKSYKSGVTSD